MSYSNSDELAEDLHSHTFRGQAQQQAASTGRSGRRPYMTSGPTLTGQQHWQQSDQKEQPASFTQQFAALQQQQEAMHQQQRSKPAPARKGGVWTDGGSTVLSGTASGRKQKQNRIANAYQTTGKSTAAVSKPNSHIPAMHSSPSTQQNPFLPPVSGAAPAPLHGLTWNAPQAFPSVVPQGARPPNLMAWVKSISKLDTNHPEQRGYYISGDNPAGQQEQYVSMQELQLKYAAQYAQLSADQQQQQFASTYPSPEQFQQFFLAQQAEQQAQQRALVEQQKLEQARERALAAQPAENPTLSLTWAPGSKGQASTTQILGSTGSQSNLARQGSQSQFIPQPPSQPSPQPQSHTASSGSLHQREPSLTQAPSSSTAAGASHYAQSSSTALLNGEVVLKAKGLTQRRQQEAKEAERLALEQEEQRLQIEAKQLREYQLQQQKQREEQEKERLIVLKQHQRQLSQQQGAAAEYAEKSHGNNQGFDFLVSPVKGAMHQSMRGESMSAANLMSNTVQPMPFGQSASTVNLSATQPSMYVHASTSQPLLTNTLDASNWNAQSQTSLLSGSSSRASNAFYPRGPPTVQPSASTAQLTSFEDVRLNSSRISVDMDAAAASAPGSGRNSTGNKIVMNLSAKDLPSDKNLLLVVYRRVDNGTPAPASTSTADLSADPSTQWEYLGSTELLSSDSAPVWDRTFMIDAPAARGQGEIKQSARVLDGGADSGSADLQLLAMSKKKHRLFSGARGAGGEEQPTMMKVQVLHVFHPKSEGGIGPFDTHLLPTPPSITSTSTSAPTAEAIGEIFFVLDSVVDNPKQEFKLRPTPYTQAQIVQVKRKQIEMQRVANHQPYIAGGVLGASASTSALQPPPVSGSITVQAQTIGILVPIDLSISCANLPVSEWMHKVDPVVVVYASNPLTGKFSWVAQTSRFRATPSPIFPERITIYSYSHCDRQLRFAVYDSELSSSGGAGSNALSLKYKERDLLGEIFVSLDELVTSQDPSKGATLEEITDDSADASSTSSTAALSFRLLKRKQVVRVAGQDSVIHIAANMRPIMLAPSNDQSCAPSGNPLKISPSLSEDGGLSTSSLNLRTPQSNQSLVPSKGHAPHFYDPAHPEETVFGARGASGDFSSAQGDDSDSVLVQLSIACVGLPKASQTSKCDPIVVLYATGKPTGNGVDALTPTWKVLSQTERFINSGEPVFHRVIQCRMPIAAKVEDGGDLRIAVYDSHETDHVRYHMDPSQPITGPAEYLVQESRLIGEHFFNARLLVAYAQSQQEQHGTHQLHLDLVRHGRIVLRRKGAPVQASTPDNLNAHGAAQFVLQVLNIDQLPRVTESETPQSMTAGGAGDALVALASSASPSSSLGLSSSAQSTRTSQIVVSISCRGLLKKGLNALAPVATNPLCVLYLSNPTSNNSFEFFSQTERKANENNPLWQKVFLLDKEIVKGEHRPWLNDLVGGEGNAALMNSALELKLCVFDVDANDLFQHGQLLGQCILPLSSLLFQSRQDLRLSNPDTGEVVGHSVLTVQSQDVGQVTKAYLAIAASGLPRSDWSAKCDPVAAVYTHNPFISQYTYAGQTERIRTTAAPVFRRLIPVDLYAEQDRPLRVGVYDTDAEETCAEQHLLGECFIQLHQLQSQADLAAAANRAYEHSLLLAQARDGKHGGMVLPKRPEVSPGLFVKLTTQHAIDVNAKRTVTASTGPLPASSSSTDPSDSATQPAEVFVQLVYNSDDWASSLESGLQRNTIFQRKLALDRSNLADFQRANATPAGKKEEQLRSDKTMVMAGHGERQLVSNASMQQMIPAHSIDAASASSGVTEEAWQSVWSFTSSKKCTLFSHLPNGIQVSSADLAALLEASKNLDGLLFHLSRFNEARRQFPSLRAIVPAIHMAIASNTHVSQDVWAEVVKWLTSKECKLWKDSKAVQQAGLSVTIQQLDEAIVGARGVDELLKHLKTFNDVHRRFENFSDVLPAIRVAQSTGAHVTDEVWQAIRSYLSNPSVGLFRRDITKSKMKVMKKEAQEKEALAAAKGDPAIAAARARQDAEAGMMATPRKRGPTNSLQVDEEKAGMMMFTPAKANAAGGAAGGSTTPRGGAGGSTNFLSPTSAASGSKSASRKSSVDMTNARGVSVDMGAGGRGMSMDAATSSGRGLLLLSDGSTLSSSPSSTDLSQLLVPASPRGKVVVAGSPQGSVDLSAGAVSNENPTGQFMLIQMSGSDVDECIIASNGSLNKLLLHLQRFDDVYRKFDHFREIPEAIRDVNVCRSYVGSTVLKAMEAYINDQDKKSSVRLFSEASVKPTRIDPPSFDHILHITGSIHHLKELLLEFDGNRRKFNRWVDLVEPIEAYVRLEKIEQDLLRQSHQSTADAAKRALPPGQKQIEAIYGTGPQGYPKASPGDRKEMVNQLSGPFLSLFNQVKEFRLTHAHLDAMLYEAGGLQQCIGFLSGFLQNRRKFVDVQALIDAIALLSSTDKPVPDGVWQEVFRFLSNPSCTLFPKQRALFARGDTSGLAITASQINECLLVPGGLQGLMIRLKHMNAEHLHFESFQELVEELRHREFFAIQRQHGHTALDKLPGPTEDEIKKIPITHAGRMAVLAYLSSRDSTLMYHVGEMKVTKEELDALIYEAHGLENCLDHLKRLDRPFKRMFGSIAELTFAIRVAHHRGYHCTELDRATLITYLANPKCLLFSTAATHPVPIEGSAIDDVMAACDGSITEVLVHLRQLDRVGRRFQTFAELPAAVALASHSQTHISNEDRSAILSYLSSPASHLFSDSDTTDHLASGPILDSIFLDNPGKTGEEILRALRKFDALNRKFHTFPELTKALKRAFKSQAFIDEQTRQTILGYLMGPNVHLLAGAQHPQFDFSKVLGEEVDELFLTVNGNLVELLGILKQLNDLGRTYTAFGELAPQVSKIRAKVLAKKQSDLSAAMSITGSSSIIAPRPQQGQQQGTQQDGSTTFFSLGGGQVNPLLLPGPPPQSNQHFTSYYDEGQNYNAANPPRISDEVFEAIVSHLTRPGLKLFSQASEGLSPNRSIADRLVWVAGGLNPLLEHFDTFNACGRHFSSFSQLLPALILAEKNHTHLLDVDQQLILTFLNGPETTVFQESGLSFSVESTPGGTLDAFVVSAGGVASFVSHMRTYSRVGRKFHTCQECVEALRRTKETGGHLAPEVETALRASLFPEKIRSGLVPLLKPGLTVSGAQMDDILAEGQTLSGTQVYLSQLEATHQQFQTIPNLLEGVRRVRNHLSLYENISAATWSAVVAWLTSSANHMFSECTEGIEVDGPTLDTLLLRTGGLSGLLARLKELDGRNAKFRSFQDLLRAIPAPASSPIAISAVSTSLATTMSAAPLTVQQQHPTITAAPIPSPKARAAEVTQEEMEQKYSEPTQAATTTAGGPSAVAAEVLALELTDSMKQQLRDHFSKPTAHAIFPVLARTADPSDIFTHLSLSSEDVKQAMSESGGSLNSLLLHLNVFANVARRFDGGWKDLLTALKEVKATGSHVPEESRVELLNHLSSPDCSLFSQVGSSDLQIDSNGIDTLLASARGLYATLDHLKILDACGRKFASFAELSMAIVIAIQKGTHVLPADQLQLRNCLLSSQLFSPPLTSLDQTNLSGLEFDRFFSCSSKRGFPGVTAHFAQFEHVGRRFDNITQLLVAVERVVGGDSYITEASREAMVEFLSASAGELLSLNGADAELTGADLDSLIFAGKGVAGAVAHMQLFIQLHRVFPFISDLIQAVMSAQTSQCHLAEPDLHQIAGALAREDSTLLAQNLKATAMLNGAGLDAIVLAANGNVGRVMEIFIELNSENLRTTVEGLAEKVREKQQTKVVVTAPTATVTAAAAAPVAEQASPATQTTVAAPAPAAAEPAFSTAAAAPSAAADSTPSKPAAKSSAPPAPQVQSIIAYVSSPACRLFTETKSNIGVTMSQLKRVVAAAEVRDPADKFDPETVTTAEDRNNLALYHIKQLDAAGRKCSNFDELLLAIALAKRTGSYAPAATEPTAAVPTVIPADGQAQLRSTTTAAPAQLTIPATPAAAASSSAAPVPAAAPVASDSAAAATLTSPATAMQAEPTPASSTAHTSPDPPMTV